jgi:glyoxylase-like metal-dependent hydrolase (beta-lactamase superfamily II)
MHRERIADDIYVFTSDLYAQVTATVIATKQGAVVFDTLLYPDETLQITRFIEQRLKMPVSYVINSHFHADHSAGTCCFENAMVIAHQRCLELLATRGREGLEQAKQDFANLRGLELRLPDRVFEGEYELKSGDKTLLFWNTPGHSTDSIVCLIKEERILLAGDTVMPIPVFADGDYDELIASLQSLRGANYEMIVQGHGEIVLRGEIEDKLRGDLNYLNKLYQAVSAANESEIPELIKCVDIETCGVSHVLLGGEVVNLHRQNVQALARQLRRRDTQDIQTAEERRLAGSLE